MAQLEVTFTFHSGIARPLFQNVRLSGSWNATGIHSDAWTESPMAATTDESGCAAFTATVAFAASQVGTVFEWGVVADVPGAPRSWVVVTEVPDTSSSLCKRAFVLAADRAPQHYWFVTGRRFGAQKQIQPGQLRAGVRFSLWAPHAQKVEVVFACFDSSDAMASGYVADDGTGIDPPAPVIALQAVGNGIWESAADSTAPLGEFAALLNRLYMYRITNEQGNQTYKVDLFARRQIGRGKHNPGGAQYTGSYLDLDGIVSCSVISDPDLVTEQFDAPPVEQPTLIAAEDFWRTEYTAGRPVPTDIRNLVIYELHVGSLGWPATVSGTFADAMNFVDEPAGARRQRSRAATGPAIRRGFAMGLWDVAVLLPAKQRRRR